MGTYKNDYSKDEDYMLWELHEIRHQLANEYKEMTLDEINKRSNNYFEKAKKRNSLKLNK